MIRHGSRRGITVVELGAALAVLGVALSGAALFARAKSGTDAAARAHHDAESIAAAARDWRRDGDAGCPTISLLERQDRLNRDAPVDDPWGNRFRVVCDGDSLSVSSPGPDGAPGTRDDVVVPVD